MFFYMFYLKYFIQFFINESNYVLRKMNQITCNITHNILFNM